MPVAVGWCAATFVTALLVVARGHKKKLIASYITQSNWMKPHREEITERYALVAREPTAVPPLVDSLPERRLLRGVERLYKYWLLMRTARRAVE